jgi:hypothetical protein
MALKDRIFEQPRGINRELLTEELSEVLPALRAIQWIEPPCSIAAHFNNPGDEPVLDDAGGEEWPPSRDPTAEETAIVEGIVAKHDCNKFSAEQRRAKRDELLRLTADLANVQTLRDREILTNEDVQEISDKVGVLENELRPSG